MSLGFFCNLPLVNQLICVGIIVAWHVVAYLALKISLIIASIGINHN